MKLIIRTSAILFFLSLFSFQGISATYYSWPTTLSGSNYLWNDHTNWSTSTSSYSPPSSFPNGPDDVFVRAGHTITLNLDMITSGPQAGLKSMDVAATAIINYIDNGSILVGPGNSFTVEGSCTLRCIELKQNATATVSTTGYLNTKVCNTIGTSAVFTINGTALIEGSFTNNGTVSGTGILTIAPGTTLSGTGTVFGTSMSNITAGQTLGGYTWRGATSIDWTVGSNYQSGAAPSLSTDFVSIAKTGSYDPHISTVRSCGKIQINIGNTLNIDAGGILTASDSVINKGTITINPGGALSANSGMSNTGTITINSTSSGTGSLIHNTDNISATIYRYITGNANLTSNYYHLVSVPLTSGANPTSNLFYGSYLYSFSESGNSWTALGTSTVTSLSVNQGYMIFYPAANHTYSFSGVMNNGTFSPTVTYAGSGKGNNLVPNPYPSAIDWEASGWTKTNLSTSIWFYVAASGNYGVYTYGSGGSGTLGTTKYIPVGQAFFVLANNTSPALSMTNSVRVHNTQSFLKETLPNTLRIRAEANIYADEALVLFRADSDPGYNSREDADKFYGNEEAPQIYLETTDHQKVTISTIPFSNTEVVIPLSFELGSDLEASFIFSEFESFKPNVNISLQDLLQGTTINIRQNPTYTFTHSKSDDPSRFRLHFNGITGVETKSEDWTNIYKSGNQLIVDVAGQTGKTGKIIILDDLGKIIQSRNFNNIQHNVFDLPSNQGLLIIQVILDNMTSVKKIMNLN